MIVIVMGYHPDCHQFQAFLWQLVVRTSCRGRGLSSSTTWGVWETRVPSSSVQVISRECWGRTTVPTVKMQVLSVLVRRRRVGECCLDFISVTLILYTSMHTHTHMHSCPFTHLHPTSQLQVAYVRMEMCGWWEGDQGGKGGWKCASMAAGELSVTTRGTVTKPEWSAGSWGSTLRQSVSHASCVR